MNFQLFFLTTCAVLTVNVQMVVGGCRLTLRARTLCTHATTSSLAEQHFNWSRFCQTRQAKTHLRIQGVPAETHTHPPARTHYSDDIPGSLLISHTGCRRQDRWARVTAWIKGFSFFLYHFLIKTLTCLHHVALPTSHIHLLEEDVTLFSF